MIFSGIYRKRFISKSDLFQRLVIFLSAGTLIYTGLLYAFRVKWGAFPTSILVISFFVNLGLLFGYKLILYGIKNKIGKRFLFINNSKELYNKQLKEYDEIVLSDSNFKVKDLFLMIQSVRSLNIKLSVLPEFYDNIISKKINGNIPNNFPFTVYSDKSNSSSDFLIDVFDTFATMVFLVFALPLTAIVAVMIKITSGGPVLYKQKRVTRDGNLFNLYKFRTMIKDAEKDTGPVLASQNDSRVTKLGKFLRKTRIDELPQLFNVLKGEMNLVGPRPERPHFVKEHKSLAGMRLAIKPGITGLAQVRSLYNAKPNHKTRYDSLYLKKKSLFLNFYIIAKTLPVMITKKGW
ncbi:MAG: sugar transferase [Atribacterota bacterium]